MTRDMQCVSDADVLGLLEGSLDDERRTDIERHLDQCAECLEVVTLASKTSVTRSRLASPDRWTLADGTVEGGLEPGSSLGRYEILEPIGRGGMGMVYAARDVQLGRRVAIKVVVPDQATSPQSNLALLREAQALARITQPNVLTVYDVGSSGDTVFLAAELVEGDTLDAWLSHPRRWRAVVDVFVQAGRGLEAVHAAGLVHRDFKPSNALVGHDGRVRVFDFGLVRFTDIAPVARELAGTPIYMSPEQRRGEPADARSDQYSFCVVLHEALWGALPGAPHARPGQVTTDRPPGWLRDAVRRGLEREPDRRFPSMRALLDVLERGLTRRRRRVQGSLASLAVVVAASTAGLGYLHGREEPLSRCAEVAAANPWNAALKARVLAAFQATGLAYAPTTASLVETVLDRFVIGWRGQRREACLAQEDDRSASKELHDRRVACLDQQWIRFEAVFDRLVRADRQVVNQATLLLEAVPDPEACLRPPQVSWPVDPHARERFAAHVREAAAVASLAQAGKPNEAAPRAAQLQRDAAALKIPGLEADATYLIGHIAGLQGRFDDAVELLEKTVWRAEAAGHDALVAGVSAELIQLLSADKRRPEEARRYVELARAAAERVGSVGARARAARVIGILELQAGHFDLAEASLGEALKLIEHRDPPDPILAANIELDLANADYQRGRPATAVPRIQRAIATFVRELGADHPRHAQALNQLGNAFMETQRPDEAAKAYERAIAIQESSLGPDHLDTIKTRVNAVGVYVAGGEFDRARGILEDCVARLERIDPKHPILSTALNNLADLHRLQEDLEGAEKIGLRALALRRERYGDHHPQVARSLLNLAQVSFRRGDLRATRTHCEEARATLAGSDVNFRAMAAIAETCMGEVELASGRRAEAQAILERALTMHGDEDPTRLADTQFALARALSPSERGRAVELARKARASFALAPVYRADAIAQVDAWLKDPTSLRRWPPPPRAPRSR